MGMGFSSNICQEEGWYKAIGHNVPRSMAFSCCYIILWRQILFGVKHVKGISANCLRRGGYTEVNYHCVLLFGIINEPCTLSRDIHLALQAFIPNFFIAYINDCTVFSGGFENHLKYFDRLINVNITLNPTKCTLFQDKIEFLEFKISANGRVTFET